MTGPSATARVRDLLILDGSLVVACDSIGGIGPGPADTVAAEAVTVGHFALRVPLLEVLCAGARPVAVVDALCLAYEPTGRVMIDEIRRLAAEAGVPPGAVTGSTEENVPTRATGIGVTVLGRLASGTGVGGGSQPGDVVVCAGLPLSAPRDQIVIGHPGQVPVAAVRAVLAAGLTHDALPVGSKGVAWEAGELAASAGLGLEWLPSGISRTDSGGPASCVLFSCPPSVVERLAGLVAPAPLTVVARLHDRA
ncbi:MAG: AIR synthase related protein [Propionicimonas sp.]